jgi:hypothetical protein
MDLRIALDNHQDLEYDRNIIRHAIPGAGWLRAQDSRL